LTDRELLVELYRRAIAAVDAEAAVRRSLERQDPGPGPFVVLAAGKAACAMARGAQTVLGARSRGGEVVTKDGHALVVKGTEVREAAHPLPDARGVGAAREALELARACDASTCLLVLLSGGASALWTAPVPSLDLSDKRLTSELLMRSGADIQALNTVRKHLSMIKGGGLARAAQPARVLTLAISDVAGDRPELIGSGPAVGDPSTYAEALAALRATGIERELPASVCAHLERGHAGREPETLKPDDPLLERVEYRLVASLKDALEAAASCAEERGLRVRRLGEVLYGEARELAHTLVREVRSAREQGVELLVAGGEPTVRVRGSGRGGRAQELALAFALAMRDEPGVTALIAGTDGSDGPTDAAGGLVDGASLTRAEALGLDAASHLERNDAYPFLQGIGDLFVTGPTHTNVTDLALIRVRKGEAVALRRKDL
jgi:glycerate-2-kinase